MQDIDVDISYELKWEEERDARVELARSRLRSALLSRSSDTELCHMWAAISLAAQYGSEIGLSGVREVAASVMRERELM